jgi:hypothetical protein
MSTSDEEHDETETVFVNMRVESDETWEPKYVHLNVDTRNNNVTHRTHLCTSPSAFLFVSRSDGLDDSLTSGELHSSMYFIQ